MKVEKKLINIKQKIPKVSFINHERKLINNSMGIGITVERVWVNRISIY